MMPSIPALSLHRPWPALILDGGKDIENRSWATRHRGLLLIHSAKPWDDTAVAAAGRRSGARSRNMPVSR